ncbi:hypothetical protein N0V82_001243 [Gnomoniopsis sp. IMI 355080]|nr:hypothetical protein N0V82_001243 [Gnomoniopsis sp. IMI 355080]
MKAAVLLVFVSTVLAMPAPAPQAGAAPSAAADPGACAAVSQAFTQQRAANPKANPRVSASLAFACLQSVPNKPGPAMKLATSVKAYSQWESTTAYLKAPPAGYGLPATDIFGGFDAIMANVTAGKFQSEYDFQLAMVLLINSAHDGHYGYRPDVFKAFSFRNDLAADIVSISADGKQVPKLYNLGLVNKTRTTVGNVTLPLDANGFPPAITKINGEDSATFLTNQGLRFVNTQDQDSQWNAMIQTYASPDAISPVAGSIIYQGDNLTLEYENGQVITQDSYALVRPTADFRNVNSGEDFYNRFCNPDAQPSNGTSTAAQQPSTPAAPPGTLQPPAPAIPGYPTPAIRDSGANATAGYFLSGAGYEDVAVLSVIGFAPLGDPRFDVVEYLVNFQKVVGDFMAMSKQANKTKLVIDVSANGGGLVIAGYELYSQLFPGTPLFQANNLRRSESLVQIANIADANLDKLTSLDPSTVGRNSSKETQALFALQQSSIMGNLIPGDVFSAGDRVNYTSTQQIINPVMLQGDTFTAYQSTPQNQTDPQFNLTGVGNRANPPPSVFAAENIVILSDGFCGSTCTLFTYLMLMQNNVKTVAVGGRPQTGPMQSVGGVEGAQVFELEDIGQAASAALFLATPDQKAQLGNNSELAILAEGYALDRAATPGGAGAVNGKNAFSHTDAKTPLQFLNQPANCKIFYTKDMIYGPEATWKRAADAAFNDPNQFCVEGSQQPLMGVQQPTNDFFTPDATGGITLSGEGLAPNDAPRSLASGLEMACAAALGSIALLL